MSWTKAKIELHLYKPEDGIYGPGSRYGCISKLEDIKDFLSERKKFGTVDFMKIVDGTFWKRIEGKKLLLLKEGESIGRPHSGCFEDFLTGLNEDFQRGPISDEYKFPKLPNKEYCTIIEAIECTGWSRTTFENLMDDEKLEYREIKKGKRTWREIKVESLRRYIRSKK